MRILNLTISIITVLAMRPALAENLDQSSVANGLESSSDSVKHEPHTGTLADERMSPEEVRKAAYRIFLGSNKAQTRTDSKTETNK